MTRSFLRLTITSILLSWGIGFIVLVVYARSLSWTESQAERAGVFLIYELLDKIPSQARLARLNELRRHTLIDLQLFSVDEVQTYTILPRPGERRYFKASVGKEWYFIAFHDGQGALAAGPVNPAVPPDLLPIGVILAVLVVPLLAGFVALRIQRELTKVEMASRALAAGAFNARVDNERGPSKELAASFNAMAERIERLIKSRDELVQAVSHELGSPLSRLRLHIGLLETASDDLTQEQRLNAMTKELDALDALVVELLGYVQSDDLASEPQSFNPTQVLTDLAELAHLEVPDDRSLEVQLQIPEQITVFADPRLFQRTVENILRNAVRYAKHEVVLELTESSDYVQVAVHDDGPGIPEKMRQKVLVPFFRLEPARDRKTGGVGLGLAIVNRIMHRHDGRTVIERSPQGGATVATLWPKPAPS